MKEKDKREIETGRESNWENIIRECRSSGNTVAAWCREHGISTGQYYYRLKKAEKESLQEEVCESVPVPVAVLPGSDRREPAILIRSAGMSVELPMNVPFSLLEKIAGLLKC